MIMQWYRNTEAVSNLQKTLRAVLCISIPCRVGLRLINAWICIIQLELITHMRRLLCYQFMFLFIRERIKYIFLVCISPKKSENNITLLSEIPQPAFKVIMVVFSDSKTQICYNSEKQGILGENFFVYWLVLSLVTGIFVCNFETWRINHHQLLWSTNPRQFAVHRLSARSFSNRIGYSKTIYCFQKRDRK